LRSCSSLLDSGSDCLWQGAPIVEVVVVVVVVVVVLAKNHKKEKQVSTEGTPSTTPGKEPNNAQDSKAPELGAQQISASSRRGPTGPRTALGKRRASRNATKHGFYSKDVLLQGESADQFLDLLHGPREYFEPRGTAEELLVDRLATLWWCGRRVVKAESAEIKDDIGSGVFAGTEAFLVPAATNLDRRLRFEVHISREFARTLNQLLELQRIRKG
jgi:hypothetical protein